MHRLAGSTALVSVCLITKRVGLGTFRFSLRNDVDKLFFNLHLSLLAWSRSRKISREF